MFALGRLKPEEARIEVEEGEKERRGEKQSLDEAFRQVALALEAVERDTREGRVGEEEGGYQAGAQSSHWQGRKAEVVSREREVRQKLRLRGRKKSLVEDFSGQPSESDLSDLFGFGLAPDDGSTRPRGNQSQGESPANSRSYLVLSRQILTVKPFLS